MVVFKRSVYGAWLTGRRAVSGVLLRMGRIFTETYFSESVFPFGLLAACRKKNYGTQIFKITAGIGAFFGQKSLPDQCLSAFICVLFDFSDRLLERHRQLTLADVPGA